MNFQKTTLLLLLVSCFFACKKDKTTEPTPGPCDGIATYVAPLKRTWTSSVNYYNTDFKPIVHGNDVIFSQLGGDYNEELVGLDAKTGALNWHTKSGGLINTDNSKVQGDRLYWMDNVHNAFVAFDLNTHTFQTLWTCDSISALISPEFQFINGDILLAIAYPTSESHHRNVTVVRVNLQNGAETELYRSYMLFTFFGTEGFLGLQTTVTSEGDTLAVFARTEFNMNVGYASRLLALNIKNKQVKQDIALPLTYTSDVSKIITKGDQLWIQLYQDAVSSRLMCFNLKTGANLWSVFTSSLKGILLINDQLVELSDYHIRAFNAQTGAENWIQGSGFYKGVLGVSSVFDLDGHLYLVQSNNIAQLDLTTGCVLNYQPIELLGNGEYVVGFTKSASEKVLYISLLEQMLAVQL